MMDNKGKLLGIAVKPAPKAPMRELAAARITTDRGVADDARGRPGRRQATVLARNSWEAACSELGGVQLPWTTRRANLFIEGVELKGKIGYDLRVGDAILTITGETTPCEVMDRAYAGLRTALTPEWRGGVTCSVIQSGDVAIGCGVVLTRNIAHQWARVTHYHARRLLKRGRATLSRVARRLRLKKAA